MIRAEKVIVTMFVNDSLKNTTVANIITHPYNCYEHNFISYLEYRFPKPD